MSYNWRWFGGWLAVAVLGAVMSGCSAETGETKGLSSFCSAAGGPIHARLEKVGILVGTPEPAAQLLAGKLAPMLAKALGVPCEVIPYGAPVCRGDSSREYRLWLGRGRVDSPAWYRADKVFYVLHALESKVSRRYMAHGLTPPTLYLNFSGVLEVSGESASALTKAAGTFAARLIPLLLPWRGIDSVTVPQVELVPQTPPELHSDRLRNWRKIGEFAGLGQALRRVYTFESTTPEADRAALGELLKKHGFVASSARYLDGTWSYRTMSSSTANVGCVYDLPVPNAESSVSRLPQALVVVVGDAPAVARDPAALLADWKQRDLRSWVLARGLKQVRDPDERRGVAERFFALPGLSAASRLEALDTLRADRACEEIFRQEFGKLCSGLESMASAQCVTIVDSLWRLSAGVPDLRRQLTTSLGSHYRELALPGPGDQVGSMACRTYAIPADNLNDFWCFFLLTDPAGEYRPYLLPVATQPHESGLRQMKGSLPEAADRQEWFGFRRQNEKRPTNLEIAMRSSGLGFDHRRFRLVIRIAPDRAQKMLKVVLHRASAFSELAELDRLRERYSSLSGAARHATGQELNARLEKLRGSLEYTAEAIKLRRLDPQLAERAVRTVVPTAAPDARGVRHTRLELPVDRKRGTQLVVEYCPDPASEVRLFFPISLLPLSQSNAFSCMVGDQERSLVIAEDLRRDALFFSYGRRGGAFQRQAMTWREREIVSPLPQMPLARGDIQLRGELDLVAGKIRLEICDRGAPAFR